MEQSTHSINLNKQSVYTYSVLSTSTIHHNTIIIITVYCLFKCKKNKIWNINLTLLSVPNRIKSGPEVTYDMPVRRINQATMHVEEIEITPSISQRIKDKTLKPANL